MPAQIRFFLPCDFAAKYFYVVEIHPDHASMCEAFKQLRGRALKGDKDVRACCLKYVAESSAGKRSRRGEKWKVTGELGTIFFVRGDTGVDVVVHELTHAAIGWAVRAKIDPVKYRRSLDHEEKFCDVLQRLVENYYKKAPGMLALFDAHRKNPTECPHPSANA